MSPLSNRLIFLSAALAFSMCVSTSAAPSELESTFLSQTRQLLFEGRRSGEGYFSPDGTQLVFQSEREPANPFYQIYVLDLRSGDTHRVSPGVGKTTCAFFRPGTDQVLFASTHADPDAVKKQQEELEFRASGKTRRYSWDYDAQMDIYLADRQGGGLRRLTDSQGYDAEGAVSPDGQWVVFCSLRDAYPADRLSAEDRQRLAQDPSWFGEIYLMRIDGSEVRRLTRQPGYDGGPFFSPDGQRIIWRRFDSTGVNADVFTMKLDGTDVRRLTDFGAMSWAPYFHPSGRYAIFTANKLGFENFELFLVDSEGEREPVRVTFSEGFDGLPVFSPNGRQLCWTSNRTPEKQSQLFLAQWNHDAALEALAKAPRRHSPTGTSPAAGLGAAHVHPPEAKLAGDRELSPEIRLSDLRQHVDFLASDRLAGRLTGSEGARLAADYLSRLLQKASLTGTDGGTNCFQPFEFTASSQVVTGETRMTWTSSEGAQRTYAVEQDFRPLSFTANGAVEGEVVFAGYGLVVPGKPGVGYDSYAGLDVSNKVVLVLRYVPEEVEPKRRQELNRYAGLRYKAMMAREHGARALLVVSGPNSPHPEDLISLSSDGSLSGSGIVAMSVKASVVAPWFAAEGKDLKELQTGFDTENPHAEGGFRLSKAKLSLAAAVRQIKQTDRNVVAILPPSTGVSEYVMVGAHYDHLGHGDGNSLHHKGEENQIHSGADDNASGVAAVLELASSIAAATAARAGEPRRGLMVAFWSGEEMGLLGSSYFAEHPPLGLRNIAAYVNFDMVGRLRENRLSLQGIGSSTGWRRLIEKRNVAAGFNLNLQEDPYLPTDVTAFYPKGIPVLNFFTGSHEDYHRPTDKPETLNYEGLERITQFASRLVKDLLQPGETIGYVKVARAATEGGSRDNLRAYLGTIPDYATEVSGVKLSGVRGGSPADKAGLKGGDVITQFAGQKIANIYDYTYALDAVKIGQPVVVVVQRGAESLTLTVTPEARK
ncbi:MAG: M28 family peptidase [Verrucomicrobiales bacterium]|nr:M28 family peptidase [Verrucomicrobiales bacterium]